MKKYFEELSNGLRKFELLLGRATLTFGVLMATFGLASQIYQNYVTQSCGISILLTMLALVLYGLRIPYSIIKQAWYLIPADLCGAIACAILAFQYFLY